MINYINRKHERDPQREMTMLCGSFVHWVFVHYMYGYKIVHSYNQG